SVVGKGARMSRTLIPEFARAYLRRYGYLEGGADTVHAEPNVAEAVQRLQSFFGLEISGEIDGPTAEMIGLPRCGLPDGPALRFVTKCPWPSAIEITYAFLEGSQSISDFDSFGAVRRATMTWHPEDIPNVPPFREVQVDHRASLLIGWTTNDSDYGLG